MEENKKFTTLEDAMREQENRALLKKEKDRRDEILTTLPILEIFQKFIDETREVRRALVALNDKKYPEPLKEISIKGGVVIKNPHSEVSLKNFDTLEKLWASFLTNLDEKISLALVRDNKDVNKILEEILIEIKKEKEKETRTGIFASLPLPGRLIQTKNEEVIKKTLKTASFSLSSTGTVVSAVVGKKIKVYAVKLIVSAAISVNWRDGASTDIEGAQSLAANGGYIEGSKPPAFLFSTTAGNTLDLVISGSGTAAGRVSYWDDDPT